MANLTESTIQAYLICLHTQILNALPQMLILLKANQSFVYTRRRIVLVVIYTYHTSPQILII